MYDNNKTLTIKLIDGATARIQLEIDADERSVTAIHNNFEIGELTSVYLEDQDFYCMSSIHVDERYRKRGIALEMIRALVEVDDTIRYPDNNERNESGLYLTQEGAALIRGCHRHGVMTTANALGLSSERAADDEDAEEE
jgi:GNAT superfamily N-acetyltransferase